MTAAYYRTMAELLRGTRFELLPRWYGERDRQISTSIVQQVLKYPGRRIAIITGCDHHGPVIAALSKLTSRVVVVSVH